MPGEDRQGIVVAILTLVTCGIYGFYWQWVTTKELANALGRDDLSPGKDLLITILTCGMWSIYVLNRNAEVVAEGKRRYGVNAESKGTIILILTFIAVFNGITALVGPVILQEELNALWKLMRASGGTPPGDALQTTV